MPTDKPSTEKIDNLKQKQLEREQAEKVKGGIGPIDSKKPGVKPIGPIDG